MANSSRVIHREGGDRKCDAFAEVSQALNSIARRAISSRDESLAVILC